MLAESTFTTTQHLAVILVFAAMLLGTVIIGRRWFQATRWSVIGYGVVCWLFSLFYFASYDRGDLSQSLPIQACDLLALFAPLSVLLPGRLPKAIVYFGAFGLTTQAFFTPVLQTGPDTMRFWVFWALHTEIVLAAVYLIAVEGFGPTWRDLRNASLFWLVYALIMIAINYFNGWYYGYLGPDIPPSAQDTVLKYLGPWPIRPIMMMLLAQALFVFVFLPWPLARWARRRGQGGAATEHEA